MAQKIQNKINLIIKEFQDGNLEVAEKLAINFKDKYPKNDFGWRLLGIIYANTNRYEEALEVNQKAIKISSNDAALYLNLGHVLIKLGRFYDSSKSLKQAIKLKPDFAEAFTNLGFALKEQGLLEESEKNLRKAIALDPNQPQSHNNLGLTLKDQAKIEEAKKSLIKAIDLRADYDIAFWNLAGLTKEINDAEHWIDKCLIVNKNHLEANLIKAAFLYYKGNKEKYNQLSDSKFKNHPYMRSFSWVFNLPNLPQLYFNKWHFFESISKMTIKSRPFYEFGVWRGASFNYLIKFYEKGFGFDTFTGLPEDWDVGNIMEKSGSYSADGIVPEVKGGEFIMGKFEDSLPVFFSQERPVASLVNFDSDLFSSTICALNYSKKIIDKDTILIFDEFLINENWEQDEYKALESFCFQNNFNYEVLAVSFFSKQVAVKLTEKKDV